MKIGVADFIAAGVLSYLVSDAGVQNDMPNANTVNSREDIVLVCQLQLSGNVFELFLFLLQVVRVLSVRWRGR